MQPFPLTFGKLWYILVLLGYRHSDRTKRCDKDERM